MQAMERWNDWLEALRVQIGSYQAIAEKLDLHHNTVLNWKVSLPDIKQEIPLATLAGIDVAVLRDLIDAARDELTASKMATERARLERRREALGRPQRGTMGSAVVPSPKRASRVRRARRFGMALLTASGPLLGSPLRVDAVRPITDARNYAELQPSGGIRLSRRRAA